MKISRMLACAMLVVPALAVVSASQNDGAAEKEMRLRGRWKVTKVIVENLTLDTSAEDLTWEFKAGTISMKLGDKDLESVKFSLDVSKTPRWINIDGDPASKAIYKFQDDELLLCFAPGAERPTDFKSKELTMFSFSRGSRSKPRYSA